MTWQLKNRWDITDFTEENCKKDDNINITKDNSLVEEGLMKLKEDLKVLEPLEKFREAP